MIAIAVAAAPAPPAPVILYDPTEIQFGRTGQQEALSLANARGIPPANVQPLPLLGAPALNINHNGYIIIITHGNSATGFETATLRTRGANRRRVDAGQMVRTLASSGLLRNRALPYRVELLICKAATGHNTFAAQFYDELRTRVPDLKVKAAVGYVSISLRGVVSVTHFAFQEPTSLATAPLRYLGFLAATPLRGIANLIGDVDDNIVTRNNLLLHDWVFYPHGSVF